MDTYNSFRMITCEHFPSNRLILNNRESRIATRQGGDQKALPPEAEGCPRNYRTKVSR